MVRKYNGETFVIPKEFEEEIRADERKKAEQDFQNSDYWNECLATVIADARIYEREKVLDEVDKYLRELSDIKSGCGEWIEKHDATIRADEREKSVKDFAEWLPKHFDLRFAINPNVWIDEYFNHTSEKVLKEQKNAN